MRNRLLGSRIVRATKINEEKGKREGERGGGDDGRVEGGGREGQGASERERERRMIAAARSTG